MHVSALANGESFFRTYLAHGPSRPRIVEIGSLDVNGSLRAVCSGEASYTGVDFAPGKGVDIVLDDPYVLPFEDATVDFCVASSVFEHSEMFWVLFVEILRILAPHGVFYVNAPSNGSFHRYPVDCWRFYPDSGAALVAWARRCGLDPVLLESYVSLQKGDAWNDFVGVFLKDARMIARYPHRILDTKKDFYNGLVHGSEQFLNPAESTEDMLRQQALAGMATDPHSPR